EIEIGAERWLQFTAKLRASYRQHVMGGETTVRALPGAVKLLKALSVTEGVLCSVVTGNFEATAEIKLEAAGLLNYLSRGAYASDSENRLDLPAIARRRCAQLRS